MSCTAADLWELQNSLKSLFLMFCALRATPHFTIFTQCMFFFYVLSKESPQSLESENIIWLCFLSHLPFPHCLVMCHPQVQHFWTCWDKTKICKPCQMLPVPFNDNDCIPSVLIFLFLFLGGGGWRAATSSTNWSTLHTAISHCLEPFNMEFKKTYTNHQYLNT